MPLQIIIGDKSLAKDSVEIKNRQTGEVHEVNINDVERKIFDLMFTLY
jgi:histidyl-tRNA synthetase